MDAVFTTADVKIPALAGFIKEVAADLARGRTIADATQAAVHRHPASLEAFDLGETTFALNDTLTFPDEPLPERITFERHNHRLSLKLNSLLADDVRALLRLCAGGLTAEQIRREIDEPIYGLFETLLEKEIIVEAPCPALHSASMLRPGVTRLQHAALYCRGREAGLLVDPHFHSSYEPTGLGSNFLRSRFEGVVDSILISQSH